MFQCPQDIEMETSMNNCSNYYISPMNSNSTAHWNSRRIDSGHAQSWSNGVEFLALSEHSRQIINNSNARQLHEANMFTKDSGHASCSDILKTIKGNRAHYTRDRLQTIVTKRKKKVVFNTQEIVILEKVFNKKPYISREERQELKETLSVSDPVLKVWFQNRRQASVIKETDMAMYSDSSEEENGRNFDLDYVESVMNKPDEFGYVTLDEKAMHQLMTAIDSILKDVDLDSLATEATNESSSNVSKYEPISPVSIQEDGDNDASLTKWKPNAPEESLRRLFGFQSLNIHQL